MKVFGIFSSRRKSAAPEPATTIVADDVAGTPVVEQDLDPEPAPFGGFESAEPDPADAFDREFDAAFSAASGSATGDRHGADAVANRELFAGIALRQTQPVKDFVRQLLRGPATKDWIGMCRPVLGSTLEAAQGVELDEVAGLLHDLDEALSMAQAEDGPFVDGTTRELVLSCYEELQSLMPEVFALDQVDSRHESVIVHALLRQVPDVGHVTLEKMYAAGFTSMHVLAQASPEDLAVTAGIREALAGEICRRVQEHEQWRRSCNVANKQERCLACLCERVALLRSEHEAYESAAEAEVTDASRAEDKREHRRLRQLADLAVELMLAEMEEMDVLEQVQKLPVARRVDRLEEFLKHGSTPHAASV